MVGVVSMVGCLWETTGDEALAGSLAESNTKRQLRRGKKAKAWDMSDYGTKADPKRWAWAGWGGSMSDGVVWPVRAAVCGQRPICL